MFCMPQNTRWWKNHSKNDIIDNSNNAIMCVLWGEQLTKQKKTLKIYAKKGIKNEIDYRQRRQHVIIDILPQKRQTPKRYQKKTLAKMRNLIENVVERRELCTARNTNTPQMTKVTVPTGEAACDLVGPSESVCLTWSGGLQLMQVGRMGLVGRQAGWLNDWLTDWQTMKWDVIF